MQKFDIILTGKLTTLSPLHIVPPNSPELKLPEGGKAREVATVPRRFDDKAFNVPVIPGSTLRGRLRRAAYKLALATQEGKPMLDGYLYNTIGGIKGAENEEVFDIVTRNKRRQMNPVIALFGAGQPWTGSQAHVSSAIPGFPLSAATVGSLRADDFARGADISEHLDEDGEDAYLAMRAGTKATSAAKGEVKRLHTEIAKARKAGNEAEVNELADKIREARAIEADLKGESGVSLQMPLAHRIMPMDVELNQTFRLLNVTSHEAGLFFAALSYVFSEEPLIGGKLSMGYGEVSGCWSVSMRAKGGDRNFVDLGEITATPFREIEYSRPEIKDFIAAWETYAASEAMDLSAIKRAEQVEA